MQSRMPPSLESIIYLGLSIHRHTVSNDTNKHNKLHGSLIEAHDVCWPVSMAGVHGASRINADGIELRACAASMCACGM